jgi:hypothetical protein
LAKMMAFSRGGGAVRTSTTWQRWRDQKAQERGDIVMDESGETEDPERFRHHCHFLHKGWGMNWWGCVGTCKKPRKQPSSVDRTQEPGLLRSIGTNGTLSGEGQRSEHFHLRQSGHQHTCSKTGGRPWCMDCQSLVEMASDHSLWCVCVCGDKGIENKYVI